MGQGVFQDSHVRRALAHLTRVGRHSGSRGHGVSEQRFLESSGTGRDGARWYIVHGMRRHVMHSPQPHVPPPPMNMRMAALLRVHVWREDMCPQPPPRGQVHG